MVFSPVYRACTWQNLMTVDFFANLTPFLDFEGFTEPANFHPAPDDYHVVIADIQGSTKAIAAGRYKDVNMMGAAVITAALNALGDLPGVAYVFGGDGATMIVPDQAINQVQKALIGTKMLCESRFGLGMRIGIVPISHLRAKNVDLQVAKFQLSPGNHLAFFRGGGAETADAMIKDPDIGKAYRVEAPDDDSAPDLEGLSCRWSPIENRRGTILSILVASTNGKADVFDDVIVSLRQALGHSIAEAAPVSVENLKFRWPPRFAGTEAKATAAKGFWARVMRYGFVLLQSALQYILHKTGGSAGSYHAPAYLGEMIANSDYRRFDDLLRLVLDCSKDQARAIEESLAKLRQSKPIAYGLHEADTALMTCLVFNLEESEHVHFIDGGDGGFAMAARQLKEQLKSTAAAKASG